MTEIPPTTTIEAIIDKIVEQVKLGKLKEISDVRDESDLSGLKITIDLKRGQDSEAVMKKLFRITPLQDVFSCNFNILVAVCRRSWVLPRYLSSGRISESPA